MMVSKLSMSAFLLVGAQAVSAQTITAPTAVSTAATTALHTAGNAATLLPAAHEVVAPVVAGTVPATTPFTRGVTYAARDVATGITKSGDAAASGGVTVKPTAAVSPANIDHEKAAIDHRVAWVGTIVAQPIRK